jgi:sulfite oxidase
LIQSIKNNVIFQEKDPYTFFLFRHFHAWRLWKITLPVHAEGWLELCCRAFDNACNTQPTYVRSTWNWDLHVTSSAHRIKIYSINTTYKATADRLRQIEENGDSLEPITRPLEFRIESDEHYTQFVKKHPREPED